MLRPSDGQVESLWDEVLPGEVRELPQDLATLDALLRELSRFSRSPRTDGWRPSLTAVRRSRWRPI
jgi:hypothetical protein